MSAAVGGDKKNAEISLAAALNDAFKQKETRSREKTEYGVGAHAVGGPSKANIAVAGGELELKEKLRDVLSSETLMADGLKLSIPRSVEMALDDDIEHLSPPATTLLPNNSHRECQPGAYHQDGFEAHRRRSEATVVVMSDPEEARELRMLGADSAGDDDSQRNAGLIQARRVSDVPNDLENAQPVQNQGRAMEEEEAIRKQQNMRILGVMLLCFVMLIAAAVLGTAMATSESNQDDATPTPAPISVPTTTPTMAPTPFIFMGLPDYTQDSILEEINSPQARAYQWTREDPQLETTTNWRRVQRFALATFYYSTSGDMWKTVGRAGLTFNVSATNIRPGKPPPPNAGVALPPRPSQGPGPASEYTVAKAERWLDYKTNECEWYSDAVLRGVPRCNETGFYRSVTLHGNNLVGTLPPELELLHPTLFGLNLRKNPDLTGPIPSQISKLQFLSLLDLGENKLTGSLPSELGLLTGTHNFRFDNNYITGSMPTEYLEVWNLRELVLSNNLMTGTIPETIGEKLDSLIRYEVHNNPKMSGTLPTSLGNLNIRIALRLDGNPFTGSLPSELGNLSNMKDFRVNNTQIASTLPSEFGQLNQVEVMDLSNNPGLYGTIPAEWSGLPTSIKYLDLQNTNISGSLPSEWKLLNETLQYLNIQGTSISGTIPLELCNIKELRFGCDSTALCGCDCPCR